MNFGKSHLWWSTKSLASVEDKTYSDHSGYIDFIYLSGSVEVEWHDLAYVQCANLQDETSFDTWLAVFWWWTANWFSAHHLYFLVGPPQSSWKSKLEGIQDKVQDCVWRSRHTTIPWKNTCLLVCWWTNNDMNCGHFLNLSAQKLLGKLQKVVNFSLDKPFRGMQEVEELLRSLVWAFGVNQINRRGKNRSLKQGPTPETSWWLNQPIWKTLVKLDHFPK